MIRGTPVYRVTPPLAAAILSGSTFHPCRARAFALRHGCAKSTVSVKVPDPTSPGLDSVTPSRTNRSKLLRDEVSKH